MWAVEILKIYRNFYYVYQATPYEYTAVPGKR